ncbi:MAG: ABC transporter ATP-binding protein [Candidatus Hinthialibacter antarcticus]|nr:ABC transporter ATP-binding protein [Candidatus Hinthialibacter antarcticus]
MIEVIDFHKAYRDLVAVEGLSFKVQPGEIMGMVGPNGAGKTTTLRSLCGIIPPTSGQLFAGGFDVVEQPVEAKRILAYIPDDPKLFDSLTVWEHLEFVAAAYQLKDFAGYGEQILKQFELWEKRSTFANELSRGMRQKVAISCAYLHDPTVLVLDEPLTGLDPRGIRQMKDSIIQRAQNGAAIVISSHLLNLVEDICTHLLMMNRVSLLFGSIDEVMEKFSNLDRRSSLEEIFFQVTGADATNNAQPTETEDAK